MYTISRKYKLNYMMENKWAFVCRQRKGRSEAGITKGHKSPLDYKR